MLMIEFFIGPNFILRSIRLLSPSIADINHIIIFTVLLLMRMM